MKSRRTGSVMVAATALAVILNGCGNDEEEPQVVPDETSSQESVSPDDQTAPTPTRTASAATS